MPTPGVQGGSETSDVVRAGDGDADEKTGGGTRGGTVAESRATGCRPLVYKVAVRPVMLYGLETVTLMKRQDAELEVAELKMLRFSLGETRMDKIRNEYIRLTAQVGRFGEKVREARLRWFGHEQGCWVYWENDGRWRCHESGNGEGLK